MAQENWREIEIELIRSSYRRTGHQTIKDFVDEVKSRLGTETYAAVINRGKSPAVESLLNMAVDFGWPNDTLVKLLNDRGERKIAKLIEQQKFTTEEKELVDQIRSLKGDKRKLKLVSDLLDTLRG